MSQDSNFPPAPDPESPIASPVSTLSNIFPDTPTLLSPETASEKPTLVMELEKTLVSSTLRRNQENPPPRHDFIRRYEIDGNSMVHYVIKRPGLDQFLEKMSSKYELVIFTKTIREYASLTLDQIDPRGLISHRLYRDSCTEITEGCYVKNLNKIGRDITQLIVIDSSLEMYEWFSQNLIWAREFVDVEDEDFDDDDNTLVMVGEFLEECCEYEDLRDAVVEYDH